MSDREPYVYDKAKYHSESVEQAGLPEEHASNHAVPILRWLIDQDLMSNFFVNEGAEPLAKYRRGEITIHALYQWWDTCLISDMISDEGNAFAMYYFDFERGKYLADYKSILQGNHPSEFHIAYSEAAYAKIKSVVDRRYAEWKHPSSKAWWQFWS